MPGKNRVTLTLAGDNDQLDKTFRETSAAADKMATDVGQASDKMAKEVGGATDRLTKSTKDVGDAYDRAAEKTDLLDTRAMGFRDTMTGVQDSVAGFSALLKGDFSADALVTAGAGIGDLASGATNLLVPAMKSARGWILRAKDATLAFVTSARGATLAMGAVGVAIGAVVLAYQLFTRESAAASVEVNDLTEDLQRFVDTGRVTGDLVKLLADDPVVKFRDGVVDLSGAIDGGTESLSKLDEGMAAFVEETGDGEAALNALAGLLGVNRDQLQQILPLLPEFQDELARAEERQLDAAGAVDTHVKSLEAFADALKAQTDPVFAFAQAQGRLEEAQRKVTEAVDEFGANSPQAEQAALDLAQAEIGLGSAAENASAAVEGNLLPMLEQMRDDGLLSEEAFRAMKGAIRASGEEAERWDGTRTVIHTELRWTHNIVGQPPQLPTRASGGGFDFQAHHAGGNMLPGWGWVGEEGPELMRVDTTTPILSNSDSRALMSQPRGGDGASVHLTVSAGRSGTSAEQAMADLMVQMIRSGALALETRDGRVVVAGGA